MPPLNRAEVWLGFGMSGMGKTRLALSAIGPRRALLYDLNSQDVLTRNAEVVDTPAALVAALSGGARRICWRGFSNMGADAFEWANRCAWACGDLALFWDEADLLMPVYPTPPAAYRIINAGRHRGLSLFATARRPSSMPRHLTAAATSVHTFYVQGERDVRYLGEWFGRSRQAEIQALQRGHAMTWRDSGNIATKKIY